MSEFDIKSALNRQADLLEQKDTIEALRAENARLQILLDGRDLFIVENGLWRQFVDDADGLKIRAEAARAAMGDE